MGAQPSKPAEKPATHVWTSETPVRFSQELVDTLQNSAETDGTRAKTLELHIQARVAEELKRLHAREEDTLNSLLSSGETAATDAAEHASSEGDHLRKLSRESVQHEISALKKKLEERKKVQDISALDKEVEGARIGVVDCLRSKEGRSLDCWREVEAFREGVRKLEDSWVEKQVR